MWIPTLAAARKIATGADVPVPRQIAAVDVLIAHGELDAADRFLRTIRAPESAQPTLQRLAATSARLRELDVPGKLAGMTEMAGKLNGPYELIVFESKDTSGTIIVFTEVTRRLWLSLPVLHLFLAPLGRRILYLKDARNVMFLAGLQGIGDTYAATLKYLDHMLRPDRDGLHVIACSAGGFVGLRAAADLQAQSFLGFSVRTDLSPQSPLPFDRFAGLLRSQPEYSAMLIDLKPYLEGRDHPGRVMLCYGRGNRLDCAHADHLRGIPRVHVQIIESATHNAVQHLVAEGRFGDVLKTSLG